MLKRYRLLILLLVLGIFCTGAYLLRWPLANGLVRRLVLPTLSERLGVRMEIASCSGQLFKQAYCPLLEGIASDDRVQMRYFMFEGIHLDYDISRLLAGDLSALSLRVERASLHLDLDRPGLDSEGTAAEAPSLPDRLPVLALASAELVFLAEGNEARLEGLTFRLNAPGDAPHQEGELGIERIHLTVEGMEREFVKIEGPLTYERNHLNLGPLTRMEEGKTFFQADLRLVESVTPRLGVDLDMMLFEGRARLQGMLGLTAPHRFESQVNLDGIDLAYIPHWLYLLTQEEQSFTGRLVMNGTASGALTDLDSVQARIDCAVEGGQYQDFSQLRVRLHAGLDSGYIRMERFDLQSGRSWVRCTEGMIPISSKGLEWKRLSARCAFNLKASLSTLHMAHLDEEPYIALAGMEAQGEGRMTGMRLFMDRIRFDLNDDHLAFKNAELYQEEEEYHFAFNALDGRIRGSEIQLLDPARIRLTEEGVFSEALNVNLGEGRLAFSGFMSLDMTGKAQVRLQGIEPAVVESLLAEERLPGEMDWEGLQAELDLEGSFDAPKAQCRCTADRFTVQGVSLSGLKLEARLHDTQVDLSSLEFSVPGGGAFRGRGAWTLSHDDPFSLPASVKANLELEEMNLEVLRPLAPELKDIEGRITASVDLEGRLDAPTIHVKADGTLVEPPAGLSPYVLPHADPLNFEVDLNSGAGRVEVTVLELREPAFSLSAGGTLPISVGLVEGVISIDVRNEDPILAEATVKGIDLFELLEDESVKGIGSAHMAVRGSLDYPEGEISAAMDQFFIKGHGPHRARLEGGLKQGLLAFHEMVLEGPNQPLLNGRLALDLNGTEPSSLAPLGPATRIERFELDMAPTDLSIYATQVGLHVLEVVDPLSQGTDLPDSDFLSGRLSARGQGTLGEPEVKIDFSLEGAVLPVSEDRDEAWRPGNSEVSIPFDLLGGLSLDSTGLKVDHVDVHTPRGSLHGEGIVSHAFGWSWIERGAPLEIDSGLEGSLTFQEFEIDGLGPALAEIRSMSGTVDGKAEFEGTLAEPGLRGHFTMRDGRIRLETRLPTLEIAEARLEADENGCRITHLNGSMGGGPVRAEGGLVCERFAPRSMDLKIFGEDVLLYRAKGIKVRSNVDVAVTGPVENALVSGTLWISEAALVRKIPLVAGKGPPSVDHRIRPLPALPPPYLSGLQFDLNIQTLEGGEVRVDNNLARGNLGVNMDIKGTGKVSYFQGAITFSGMLIKLPTGIRFRVETGRLFFTEQNPFMPSLSVTAEARRYGYDLNLIVQGPLNDPGFIFSSNPPLDNDSIRVLLTTGSLPQQLVDSGVETQAMKQVGTYFGEELISLFSGGRSTEDDESFSDRFAVNWGEEMSKDGVESIVFEFHLDGPWYLQAERDIYSDMNLGGLYRIRFK